MRFALITLLFALPAAADWPSLDSSCEVHQAACYADLAKRAQELLKKGETLQGSDWRLKEMAPNRATAVREVFREGDLKAVSLVQAVLVLGRDRLKIDGVQRK